MRTGGNGRRANASAITCATSTSWWKGSVSRPMTSMSAWTNSR
jgi:hypothetical protein